VVIGQLDIADVTIHPAEADAILIGHANTVLSSPAAFQCLKAIARWNAQVIERARPVEQPQTPERDSGNTRPPPRGLPVKQLFSVTIAE